MKIMIKDLEQLLNNGYYYRAQKKKDTAILILHGFAASPIEQQPLAEYLKDDYDIYAPILPGHTTNITDFSKQKYTTWLSFSEKIYDELLKEYSKVILLGFSMGGTICLHLSTKKRPHKLITMSAPINFLDPSFGKLILADWKRTNISLTTIISEINEISKKQSQTKQSTAEKIRSIINNIYSKRRKDFIKLNNELLKYEDTYKEISTNAIHQIFQLVSLVKKQISKVNADILIIHSKKDYLIPVSNSKEIMLSVSSNNVERFLLEESGHQVMLDTEYEIVFKKVKEFISREI
jgi:carboxylesterase